MIDWRFFRLAAEKIEREPELLERSQAMLALVKLVVGRKKDLDLVTGSTTEGELDADNLMARYRETPLAEPDMFRAERNLPAATRASVCGG